MTYTLLEHSWDHAHDEGAPDAVASAYATHVTEEAARLGYGLGFFAVSAAEMWQAWAGYYLSDCPGCGSIWALRQPDGSWECQDCAVISYPPGAVWRDGVPQ